MNIFYKNDSIFLYTTTGMFLGYAVVQLPGFLFMLFGCSRSPTNTSKDYETRNNRKPDEKASNSEYSVPCEFRYTSPPSSKEKSNTVHPRY